MRSSYPFWLPPSLFRNHSLLFSSLAFIRLERLFVFLLPCGAAMSAVGSKTHYLVMTAADLALGMTVLENVTSPRVRESLLGSLYRIHSRLPQARGADPTRRWWWYNFIGNQNWSQARGWISSSVRPVQLQFHHDKFWTAVWPPVAFGIIPHAVSLW